MPAASSMEPRTPDEEEIILLCLVEQIEGLAPRVPGPALKDAASRISALVPLGTERRKLPKKLVISETLRMTFEDDQDEAAEPSSGAIVGCEIELGNREVDGGFAIETVFERKAPKALQVRLRDYAEHKYYWLIQRNFVHPPPPDEYDDEEDKQEYWQDVRRVRWNRALLVLAVSLLALSIACWRLENALLMVLASFEGLRETITLIASHEKLLSLSPESPWLPSSLTGSFSHLTSLSSYSVAPHAALAGAAATASATASAVVLTLLEAVPIGVASAFRPEGLCDQAPVVELFEHLAVGAPCRGDGNVFYMWPE